MIFGQTKDVFDQRPFLKVLVYGQTGAGKTWWAARTPRPLYIAKEPQGVATFRLVRDDGWCAVVESWQEFGQLLTSAKFASPDVAEDGTPCLSMEVEGTPIKFQTIIVDSFTAVQQLMIRRMSPVSAKDSLNLGNTQGLTLKQWGRLINVCNEIMTDLRALPCNVVVTCLSQESSDDDRIRVVPSLAGKSLPTTLGQYFNAVGYATRDKAGRNVIVWKGDSRFVTKPASPAWPDVMPNDISLGSLLAFSYPDVTGVAIEGDDSADALRSAMTDYTAKKETT